MANLGPKAHRRRLIHLYRLFWWMFNLLVINAMYVFTRDIYKEIAIPYLLNVSVIALIEGAWSSYSADSPLDE